ncbi:MAG: S8 family serine peptidase [Acidobacteriota bacterium]
MKFSPRRFVACIATAGALCALSSPAALGEDLVSPTLHSGETSHQVVARILDGHGADIAQRYGLTLVDSFAAEVGEEIAVLSDDSLDAEQILYLLEGDGDVLDSEAASHVALLGDGSAVDDGTALDLLRQGTVTSECYDGSFRQEVWSGFGDQQATAIIESRTAQEISNGCGNAVVALLDTGVDPRHPMLREALVDGYDFINRRAGVPSEWANLNQSVSAILEQSVSAILEQSVSAILEGEGDLLVLDASLAPITGPDPSINLDGIDVPPYFGHGTMAAGLIRVTAPGARIMPIRVFDGSGQAHLYNIIRGIYWATDQGADIISMSFSTDKSSRELRRAIRYAHNRGVLLVAAAGNRGQRERAFPASYWEVTGVASTDFNDQLSEFSNYGQAVASIAAPGSAVISTYPGGLFAAGWGTSFSAPLVSGTFALMLDNQKPRTLWERYELLFQIRYGADNIDDLRGYVIRGRRLNVRGAIELQ